MKSVAELKAAKEKAILNLGNSGKGEIRVVVGMATCGIAAGASPVLDAFTEEVSKHNLKNVHVAQTGCIGVCRLEPIVEITENGKNKVTYVQVKPEMVPKIVKEHLIEKDVVSEYTISAVKE